MGGGGLMDGITRKRKEENEERSITEDKRKVYSKRERLSVA